MAQETINDVLAFMQATRIGRLDITGGAPELNEHFRDLVSAARSLGAHVMDRCNLTILEEAGQEDLARFPRGDERSTAGSNQDRRPRHR